MASANPRSSKEQETHEQGLVSVLRQIHDDLDAAVFAAYGWPATLSDEETLERLVALNAERAAEERRGLVRWLRPDYQQTAAAVQGALHLPEEQAGETTALPAAKKQPWPKTLAEQAQAIRAALAALSAPALPAAIARSFQNARQDRVAELLETLASLGQARRLPDGQYIAQ